MCRITLFAVLAAISFIRPVWADDSGAVVSIGGSTTEIIYALGLQDRLVGRDRTSTFPPEAKALPDVGYMRALSPEGVLSVEPQMILAEEGAGPVETIEVLAASGVRYVTIPEGYDAAAVREKITTVGAAFGAEEAAEALATKVEAEIAKARQIAEAHPGPAKRVLFVLSTEGGRIMAAGSNSSAEGILVLAGAENALTGFEGYKLMSDEAIAEANPDAVLMMSRGGGHSLSDEELWALPALSPTTAAANGAVVRMDGLLMLGFGPRVGTAVTQLSRALYGS